MVLTANDWKAYAFYDLQFKHYNRDHGLSNNTVNCVYKDSRGYVWSATEDGVSLYNAYDFEVFRHSYGNKNSLGSNITYSIYEDDSSDVWVGTMAGVDVFDRETHMFSKHYLKGKMVHAIFRTRGGRLLAGADKGLYVFDRESDSFQLLKELEGETKDVQHLTITSISQDLKGRIWVGTYMRGLYFYDFKKERFKHVDVGFGNGADRVRKIVCDDSGNLWIGTFGGGLVYLDLESKTAKRYSTWNRKLGGNLLTDMVLHKNGDLLISSDGTGLLFFSTQKKEQVFQVSEDPLTNGLATSVLRCVHVDAEQSVWLGSSNFGIAYTPDLQPSFSSVIPKVGKVIRHNLSSFAVDRFGGIWMGSDGKGLSRFDRRSGRETKVNGLQSNHVLTLKATSNDEVWIGTFSGGLSRYDLHTGSLENYKLGGEDTKSTSHDIVWSLLEDRQKRLWVGTHSGLDIIDLKSGKVVRRFTPENSNLLNPSIRSMLQDQDGTIWLATQGGLMRYDEQNDTFEIFKVRVSGVNRVEGNWMLTLAEGNDSTLWIGTFGAGIFAFDKKTKTFSNLELKQGNLPGNVVGSIGVDEQGRLWIGSQNGLSCVNPVDQIAKTYNQSHGLISNSFTINSSFYFDDYWYFGTTEGLACFKPSEVHDNNHVPPVEINSLKIFNHQIHPFQEGSPLKKEISEVDDVTIDYDQSVITFGFVALNYIESQQNKYAYWLEGFDKTWNEVGGQHSATYTNLDPGTYIFHVKACNNDGYWNEAGRQVVLHIRPPFWMTWWFRLIILLVIVGVVYLVYHIRMKSIMKQKRRLEIEVSRRTLEVKEQNKKLRFKNKQILSSIEYATRIQQAILPDLAEIKEELPNSFIYYRPKDMVSGDFYWYAKVGEKLLLAAIDCTGHGVPGAFMSMIGNDLLNQIVLKNDELSPEKILTQLNRGVREALKQDTTQNMDGMDMSLLVIDKQNNLLEFAGARNPLYLLRGNGLEVIPADRASVGGDYREYEFTKKVIDLDEEMQLFLFTDGYKDQIGGDTVQGKKYMAKKFKKLLSSVAEFNPENQLGVISKVFDSWRGDFDQVDDVLLIGLQVAPYQMEENITEQKGRDVDAMGEGN